MKKTIAQFLPALLALVALVILVAGAFNREEPAGTEPVTTQSQAQIVESTEAPVETRPADARPLVEAALGRYVLDETASASCFHVSELHEDEGTTGAGKGACGHALADVCDEQRMNPVAAFWLLTEEGLYDWAESGEEIIRVPAFTLPIQSRKAYPWTAEGTRLLLTDILKLSAGIEEGMEMEVTVLGGNEEVDSFQVFYDEEDCCYYAYFILYGERSAHFLCFYTRGGEQIDDLEFQLLNLRYAEGDEEALQRIDQLGDCQGSTIMAAAEQLLTGTSRADEGRIPLAYTCDSGAVTIERYAVTGNGETGTLTNYDLRIAQ